jgi:hypothetical protein
MGTTHGRSQRALEGCALGPGWGLFMLWANLRRSIKQSRTKGCLKHSLAAPRAETLLLGFRPDPSPTATSSPMVLSHEESTVHDAALGWAQIHLCRPQFETLYRCKQQGADCTSQQRTADECKSKSKRVAWLQLQSNGMVQCPREWSSYSDCMTAANKAPTEQERGGCNRLWMELQMCAAFHVVAHVESQGARADRKFVPPPMYMAVYDAKVT